MSFLGTTLPLPSFLEERVLLSSSSGVERSLSVAATIINNSPGIIDGPARIYASKYTLHALIPIDRQLSLKQSSSDRPSFQPFHRRPTTFLLLLLVHGARKCIIRDALGFFFIYINLVTIQTFIGDRILESKLWRITILTSEIKHEFGKNADTRVERREKCKCVAHIRGEKLKKIRENRSGDAVKMG